MKFTQNGGTVQVAVTILEIQDVTSEAHKNLMKQLMDEEMKRKNSEDINEAVKNK